MAVTRPKDESPPAEMLNPGAAKLAASPSIALGLAGIAITVYYLTSLERPSGSLVAAAAAAIAILTVVCITGVQLIRGKAWAQQVLLVVFLAGLIFVVCVGLAGMLDPEWWDLEWSMWVVLIPPAALQVLAVFGLTLCSSDGTRLRYASNVALAIAAALALIIALNLLSHTTYTRRNIETLQRFSLSQRTKQILDATDEDIRLTCVYTSTKDKSETADRRRRVTEFMREMREYKKSIQVENCTTDTQKAKLVERLREKLVGSVAKHDEFLKDFQIQSKTIIDALTEQQIRWEQAAGRSYLDQWGFTPEVARLLKKGAEEFQRVADNVKTELSGTGLPDYQQLVSDVKGQLTTASDTITAITSKMKEVSQIAPKIEANRDSVLKSADSAEASVEELLQVLGPPEQAPPNPSEVLQKFASAADKAIRAVQKTVIAMRQVAGKEHVGMVNTAQAWVAQTGQRQVNLPIGAMMLQRRDTVPDLYEYAASNLTRWKLEATAAREAANIEHQGKAVRGLGKAVTALLESLKETRKSAEGALQILSTIDDPTRKILQEVTSGEAFREISEPVEKLLESARDLGELEEDTISEDITRDNIVIVETGDKTKVLDFETVWPIQFRPTGMLVSEGPEKRSFNGDSAISSEILAMTNEPFATVLITYYRPDVPPEMRRMLPRETISPEKLSALTERLKEANFAVEQWNLAKDRPEVTGDRPQVLLVLPPANVPPMSMVGQNRPEPFGQEHTERLRNAIDEGTPAIFLANFEWPRPTGIFGPPVPPPYLLKEYLEQDWGIEVLTDYRVIPAVPDQQHPGKMRVDIARWDFFPLSSFTDHVVGRDLQAQRMIWTELAVVRKGREVPESISIEPLLTVPSHMRNVWASRRVRELVIQFRTTEGSFISPDYEAGDIPAPFDVAVVATRPPTEAAQGSRIVVMGTGMGMVDGYLDGQSAVLNPDGSISSSDPPRTNAEMVINSVYWLIGLEGYIARGPAQIKPVAMIPSTTMTAIRVSFIVGLPLVALLPGGVVLFIRRK